jgi:nicotinamide mononucleotide transporter
LSFFDINNVIFHAYGYPVSYIEFVGTIFGAISIWLSAKANIWSFPIGLIYVVMFFFVSFQVQLYPDMFLQVFFFITNAIGWWRWANPKPGEEDRKHELKISFIPRRQLWLWLGLGLIGTILFGLSASRLHEWLPSMFSLPSAFPYMDSFITVMSIIATFLMIEKKVESWIVWILVDVVATYLYFSRELILFGLEFGAFCFLAGFGLWNWVREYRGYSLNKSA